MNRFAKTLVISILFLIVLYWSIHPQSAPIRGDLQFETILGMLGGLFVLVLLIERATEIAIAIWREAPTQRLQQEINTLSEDSTASDAAAAKTADLLAYQAETKGIALLIGFTLSVIACAGGIGILDTIVDTSNANKPFMRGMDIILTSGLLAGGSDAFHQFVRALESFFVSSRKKNGTT
ncbi:hypothetical protein [Desulfobulbus alkaliphilus]|uniref:hypothetical protein n=1 Tax=Desulfobulbus alkaliphilus TaxID=869814 RepID=UPI00196543CF|nr:hypothetical protein [Desulfobulbus alkaliphilus]MBM9535675.1 hypothetical protein [Desulfobulbus alkaliphilus]